MVINMTIPVAVIDPHAIVREGIHLILECHDDIEVVAECGGVTDLDSFEVAPRVVVIEPGGDGSEAERAVIGEVHRRYPDAAVLVLTMLKDLETVERALDAGACGYVLKSSSTQDFLAAVRHVARGDTYVQPDLASALIGRRGEGGTASPFRALSERQRQVLEGIAHGYTNREIAAALGVCLRTVESDRSRLYRLFGARSRADLVRTAIEGGLVR